MIQDESGGDPDPLLVTLVMQVDYSNGITVTVQIVLAAFRSLLRLKGSLLLILVFSCSIQCMR
jgi:hypothetical protein